jgi:membrane protein DedA with SNARE-associated domain
MGEQPRETENRTWWRLPFGARADRRLVILSAIIAALYGAGLLGLALAPILTREQPILLLLLNPTTTILLLVSARIELIWLVALVTARRFLVHIVFYLLGWWYAEAAIDWMVGRSTDAEAIVGQGERIFRRIGWLAVLIWPGPFPSVLSGASRMIWPLFVAIDLIGTIVSIVLTRYAASIAANPLDIVRRFIDANAEVLTIICVAAVVLWLGIRWLQGRRQRERALRDAATD